MCRKARARLSGGKDRDAARHENERNDPGKDVDHVRSLPVQISERNAVLFFGIDDLPPGVIWIERGHLRGDAACSITEISLVDVTIIVDDEGHDAGIAVFRRISDKAEAADHVAVDNIVYGAAGRGRALP